MCPQLNTPPRPVKGGSPASDAGPPDPPSNTPALGGPPGGPAQYRNRKGTTMADSLTGRQRKILEVITESIQCQGYAPCFREIGEAAGLSSKSSVSYQIPGSRRWATCAARPPLASHSGSPTGTQRLQLPNLGQRRPDAGVRSLRSLPAPGPASVASPDWAASARRPPGHLRDQAAHDHSVISNGEPAHAGRRGGLGPVLHLSPGRMGP